MAANEIYIVLPNTEPCIKTTQISMKSNYIYFSLLISYIVNCFCLLFFL